ncbi:MAG: hypothetical protein M1831_004968 [Alyxoria varia]|nr:MAG: hypothetical protein M1831_004968 [Alyxoria varia]
MPQVKVGRHLLDRSLPLRLAAVTGANRGLGHAIVRNLALRYPHSKLNDGNLFRIYMTARDVRRGIEARNGLAGDKDLRKIDALHENDKGFLEPQYLPLDLQSFDSISAFVNYLNREHPDGIDILVNNAGIAIETVKGFSLATVDQTLATNYYGTLKMTEELLPIVAKKQGRIVNISSMLGKLQKYPASIAARFREAKDVGEVTELVSEFRNAVAAGDYEEKGWPRSAYAVSKSAVTAISRILGQKSFEEHGVLLNSCCPGYVQTEMTHGRGRKTPDQGARTPLKLAIEDIDQTSGKFWEHEEVSTW